VLVGGVTPALVQRGLHALVDLLAERPGDTVLLASDDATYLHPDVPGVLLRVAPEHLASAIATLQPDVVVIDGIPPPAGLTLECLAGVPYVLAGAVASEPAALLPRWLSPLVDGDLARAQHQLATHPIGLVMTHPSPDERMPFSAWVLSEGEQIMGLTGQTGALTLSLEKQGPLQRRLRLHRG